MRLLVASRTRGPIGGVESYLRGIVPALVERGHDVAVLFERRLEPAAADGDSADPYRPCAAEWSVPTDGLAAALAAARAWRPDAVWLHGLESAALEAGLLELAPATLHLHNYDGLCATGERLHRWPAPTPCARAMGAACVAMNFTRHCGRLHPAAFAASFQRQRQRAAAWPRYRRLLVASRHMADAVARSGRAAPPVSVVPYPLLAPRAEAPPAAEGPPRRLLMLARLTAGKGADVLLRALARLQPRLPQPLSVVIAGDGPEQAPLGRLAQRLGLQLSLPGWVSAAQRQHLLAASDVLVVPSLWPEPFGLTGLEAAAQAVPAVAFAVGGIPEWLLPGLTGELAPAPPSVDGMASALARLLTDPERWQRQRLAAWQHAAGFNLSGHLAALETLLA
ncbi:MAG: glycosyltransferase family 4 protein [Terriglobales bacterium]